MKYLISILILLFLIFPTPPASASDFLMPLPDGKLKITNDYAGHNEYMDNQQFSLDLQAGEIPSQVKTNVRQARCYTYGEPIVAAREGTVLLVVSDPRRHDEDAGYGTYVQIVHADNSVAVYGHMIYGTNREYVRIGDLVKAGQIIGLMGDTGNIKSAYEDSPCAMDKNFGAHLHFEIRNLKNSLGKFVSAEPLGTAVNFIINKLYASETIPSDPGNIYANTHAGKYPYVLNSEKVYSITPLQALVNSNADFVISGENFSPSTSFVLPFCASQQLDIINSGRLTISCRTKSESGLMEMLFKNSSQPNGVLKAQIELQSAVSGPPSISELNFVSARPGEFMDFHMLGNNLPGDLKVDIKARGTGEEGNCDNEDSFYFLSPENIKTQCRLPLNLGAVDQKNEQEFEIKISDDGGVLYANNFKVNYGISAVDLLPRSALYYTPTRFKISGKNVHRTTVFYIEGCAKSDFKVISRNFDELELECLIQPKPKTDLSSINGKTFAHVFLFKTESRFDGEGANKFDDGQDREHVIISGYIDLTYDREEKIESVSPREAIIGQPTIFTVTGKNLPFANGQKLYSVWLEHCGVGSKNKANLNIIPGTYTPYGFDFECVPEFDNSISKGKSDFEITKVLEKCDRILEQNWSEAEKNTALEKCHESDNPLVKRSMWGYFDKFFATLAPRRLHVKKSQNQNKNLVSEQEVRFISPLYYSIRNEKQFQVQYMRQDGDYNISGAAIVKKVLAGEITRKNRHQKITVIGENLPRTLEMVSGECSQISVSYGSSENYEFVCLLKKVPVQEILIIDAAKRTELHRSFIDLVEVYEVEVFSENKSKVVHLRGVNLDPGIVPDSDNCSDFSLAREPSSTELVYNCNFSGGIFSGRNNLDLNITSKDQVLLFEGKVAINSKELEGQPKKNIVEKKQEPKILKNRPLFDSKLLSLICESTDNENFFLGECRLSSEFLNQALVQASYDKNIRLAVLEGVFESSLGKVIGNLAANNLNGLKLNPAAGSGMITVNLDDQSLLINGQINAIGFDASTALDFPFDFDLYDFQGQLMLTYPYFDINKSREKSKIVFGLGNLPGEQITFFSMQSNELKKRISQYMKTINASLNKKKIEIGAKLISSIENTALKKFAGKTYIKILKALEIVPEAVGFYDNFDFMAKGKLKSEPFRPANYPEDKRWALEANLAMVELDFLAKTAELKLKGEAINNISILNNEIIKTDRGLLNLGITIALNRDEGRLDLDQIELRLPGNFASAKADAHIIRIFKPLEISTWGNINSSIVVRDLELAKAGASFLYDPNLNYQVGNFNSQGVLRLDGQLKAFVINAKGKTVFTVPDNQLVMDLGGELSLDFLNTQKKLADVLGRTRIGKIIKGCYKSETGRISMNIPFFEKPFEFKGDISLEAEFENVVKPRYLTLSGQTSDGNRIGFKYDNQSGWIGSFSKYYGKCDDAPEENFLTDILSANSSVNAQLDNNLLAASELSPGLFGQTEEANNFSTNWNLNGWKSIELSDANGNELILLDKDGKELPLDNSSFEIPGLWKFDAPPSFLITNQKEFLETGYQFAIRKNSDTSSEVTVKIVTEEKVITNKFSVGNFLKENNVINIDSVNSTQELKIEGQTIKASSSESKEITPEDFLVQAEISSEKLNIPDSDSQLRTLFPDIKSPLLLEAVNYLTERGIISGYPDGTFKPEQIINRAEALKIIFESIGISDFVNCQLSPVNCSTFPDVPANEWYSPYVSEAKSRGIINGYADGGYKPTQFVNKAEFLKIAMSAQSAYAVPPSFSPALTQFSDLDKSQWYMPFVTYAVENAYLDKTTKLKPTEGMTRGEAAMIIYRMLKTE